MKDITQTLAIEIETAVKLIVAATQRAAVAAVTASFKTADRVVVNPGADRGGGSERRRSASVSRRSRAEIEELASRFSAAVHETPGETIAVLAKRLESTAQALQVPVLQLKNAGRIKAVGHRQFTRYFPLVRAEAPDGSIQEAA